MPRGSPTVEGTPPNYEIVNHTADWAIRVYGVDMADLLSNAAKGMSYLLIDDLSSVPSNVQRQIEMESIDAESLLVDWLSELAYWAESELLVFTSFSFAHADETQLKATLTGGEVPALTKHIKAVTYNDLDIVETESGLVATVVFDV
jgi:SHS2 domain-containing protein